MSSRISLWGQKKSPSSKNPAPTKAPPVAVPPRRRPHTPLLPSRPAPTTTAPVPVSTPVEVVLPVNPSAPGSNDVEAGAWERPRQELPSPHLPDQRYGKRKFQRVPKDKTRRHALSVSVSIEEEDILRGAAVEAGTSFSDWARRVLFKAAGKKLPSRTRGGAAVTGE